MSEVQVDKSHYAFGTYGFEGRFVSYFWQLKEVLDLHPSSVLEVGVGDKVFGNFLKDNTAVAYTSVDVAKDLKPDVLGSILELPFADKSVDVACAFEVLEHLPDPEQAMREIARVASGSVVLSVPWEPVWRLGNLARGRYLSALGNTPGHVNHWSKRSFVELLSRHGEVVQARSPFPWTMLLVRLGG